MLHGVQDASQRSIFSHGTPTWGKRMSKNVSCVRYERCSGTSYLASMWRKAEGQQMHLQKATNRGMLDFCFAGKLPFSPLIGIKSGLWYASAGGRKAHFLHICVEKRCPDVWTWKNSTLQSSGRREGLIFPPHTFSFAQRLDWNDTVRRLRAGGLAAASRLVPPVPRVSRSEAATRQKARRDQTEMRANGIRITRRMSISQRARNW